MLTTIGLIALFILAGLSALGAVLFLVRSLAARSGVKKRTYGVERQSARQEMLVYAFVSAGLTLFMLLFCGAGTLLWATGGSEGDEPTAVPTAPEQTDLPLEGELTPVVTLTPLPEEPTPTATPTLPVDEEPLGEPATPTPLPTATIEPTPEFATAVVNSPFVGLYLRAVPGGEIIERLEDQAVVFLLGPEETLDEIRWVEVTAVLSGNTGWVAADFLADEAPEAQTGGESEQPLPPEPSDTEEGESDNGNG